MTEGQRSGGEAETLSILHVVPYFPPNRIGGVGEVVAHLHHALLRQGHRSRVLTTGSDRSDPDVIRAAPDPVSFVFTCWRHVRLAREADVVHVHHGEALGLIAAMRALRVKTPVLLTLHVSIVGIRRSLRPFEVDGRRLGSRGANFLRRTLGMRVRHRLDLWAKALADGVSFISRSAAEDVLPREEAERARVIYNGVPERRERPEESPEPVDLLFVGTYNVRKRVQILPFILCKVRESRPDCRMRVIGFTPERHPEFSALARALEVEDAFVFEGRLPSHEIPRFYQASRVLLVPSAYEGLPMVILEAFQNGLPCVATRVSGHPEIIEDGRNGFLVTLDQPGEMAEAALKILKDPAMGLRMGAQGRAQVAHRFGVERQVEEYLDLYRELRARYAPARRRSDEALAEERS